MGNKLVTAFHNDKTDRRPAFPQDDLACPEDTHTFFPRQPAPALSPADFARQDGFVPQPLSPRALRCLSQPHAMSNIAVWPRGRCAPLEPPTSRAAAGPASGGCRRREPRRRCDPRGPPQRSAGVLRDRRGGAPRQPLCGYKGSAGLGALTHPSGAIFPGRSKRFARSQASRSSA